jgi:hypothetical protein
MARLHPSLQLLLTAAVLAAVTVITDRARQRCDLAAWGLVCALCGAAAARAGQRGGAGRR